MDFKLTITPDREVAVIAHRGYRKKYPENTLLAFEKAMEAGADYSELDVYFSKDGKIVVIHDGSTDRVGVSEKDKGHNIKNTDYEILSTLDIGQGQKIPLLSEVFDLCKGKMGIQVEIKMGGMAEAVIKLIEEKGMEKQVLLSSFNHDEMSAAKKVNPNIPTATLEPNEKSDLKNILKRAVFIEKAKNRNVDAIHLFYRLCNKKLVDLAHEQGYLVNPWTVNSKKKWKKLIKIGVDAIITDDPGGLVEFLNNK